MKSERLLCVIALSVFVALTIPAGLAGRNTPYGPVEPNELVSEQPVRPAPEPMTFPGIAALQEDELDDSSTSVAPNATLSPTSLLFRCRNVINAGCQCITLGTTKLSNLGSSTLSIGRIATTGAFTQTNDCGKSLRAGESCTIAVHWSLVNSAGGVDVYDNAPHSPQKVSLSGFKGCSP